MQRGGLLSWPLRPLIWVGHTEGVTCISYSPDGCNIVSGSKGHTIRIWNADTGSEISKPLEGHTDTVSSVAYSLNGRHIVSGSKDKTVRIWDAKIQSALGKPLVHDSPVLSVAWSPDGTRIASGSDGKMILWDVKTVSPLRIYQRFGVTCIAFSPDGHDIVSGCRDAIEIWDVENGSAVGKPLEGSGIIPESEDGVRVIFFTCPRVVLSKRTVPSNPCY